MNDSFPRNAPGFRVATVVFRNVSGASGTGKTAGGVVRSQQVLRGGVHPSQWIWGFPKSWGYPNFWMVYFMEHPPKKWMMV